jgi:methylmalonyl-CoA mutase
MTMTISQFASEFPAVDQTHWRAMVEKVLKGADFEKKLVSRTADGLRVDPIYRRASPSMAGFVREIPGAWRIAQRVDHPVVGDANSLALADLEGGADALVLAFEARAPGQQQGVVARSVDDLDRVLAGVMLDLVHLRLDAGGRGRQVAALMAALARRRGHAPGDLSIDFGLDPIGAFARLGRFSAPWKEVAARSADTAHALGGDGFPGGVFLCDGRVVHDAGGSEAQELAFVLACGVAYLRALEEGGHDLDAARRLLSFLLVADTDEFLTVAKLRAIRRLWARIEQSCGLVPRPIRLHAETAWRMMARRDPWTNMLRGTLAAFSAGIGGADSVLVLPFTAALGLPDAFARRIARNTQLILLEEANLARVADPAAGSGAFEALTEALSAKAWGLFQDIEREGGIAGSLASGLFQARMAALRAGRERAVATRREPITGVSEFPNVVETRVGVVECVSPPGDVASREVRLPAEGGGAAFRAMLSAAGQGASIADLTGAVKPSGVAETFEPVPVIRLAAPFEALRDAADVLREQYGTGPRIFLANLGRIADFTARAMFAKNLFEAGGFEAVANDGFADTAGGTDIDALADAFRRAGTPAACLCGSDAGYAAEALLATRALRAAGAASVWLAGRPGEDEAALREAGIEGFVHLGCDALATLNAAHAKFIKDAGEIST